MPAANSNSVEEVKAQLLSELYDLRVRPLKERKKKWQECQLRWHPDKNLGEEAYYQLIFTWLLDQKDWFLDEKPGLVVTASVNVAERVGFSFNPESLVEGFDKKSLPEWYAAQLIATEHGGTFKPGDPLKTLHPAIVRRGECTSSESLAELAPGIELTVLGVGSGYRLHVAVVGEFGLQGWLSSHTKAGEPLV
eukprot:CAMPEP_0115078668 /NCGR_PEP_ID=MMETSP0227-20121206/17676_1 /TAXON_ID=89957 /ORGANISM="Polarella glacialis, Strain CCMP 1383" /LENGTH=192 /DNA_ID=CAMNT_0002466077 /DNA_START=47 /DNA_END=625 /DNA_ORIENTATION=+